MLNFGGRTIHEIQNVCVSHYSTFGCYMNISPGYPFARVKYASPSTYVLKIKDIFNKMSILNTLSSYITHIIIIMVLYFKIQTLQLSAICILVMFTPSKSPADFG